MAYQIQIRSDVANNWSTVDPILAQGEMGYETDTGQLKFGDGATAWANLSYFAGGGNGGGTNYSNANVAAYLAGGMVGNIIPAGNAVYSLGNLTHQWKDLWISSNTIYIETIPISLSSNQDLTVNGNPVVTANANANGATNVTSLDVSGNLSAQTASVSGNISTGNYFVGDGGLLSNINAANVVGGYGDANVAVYLPNNTANVNATFFTGDGGLLSNIHADWNNVAGANANIAAYLASGLMTTPIVTSANVTGGNVTTAGVMSATGGISTSGNILAAGNVAGGNLLTTGVMSAAGNVTGANVTTGGVISAAGNISTNSTLVSTGGVSTTGNVYTTNINATGNVSTTGNIAGGNITSSGNVTSNNITVTSSIVGNTVSATGSIGANNLSISNTITANSIVGNNATINNNLQVGGNLFITGNTTTANVTTLEVSNSLIFAGANNITNLVDQGLVTPYGDGSNVWYGGWARDASTGIWNAFANVTTKPTSTVNWAQSSPADIQVGMVYGNIANATGLAAAAYTGDYNSLINQPAIPTHTSNLVNDSGFITNLVSGNFSVTGTTTTGEFSSQGNVVAGGAGTFTGNVSAAGFQTLGGVSAGGNIHGSAITSDGVVQAGGNVSGTNFNATGMVSAVGNVHGLNVLTGTVYAGNAAITGSVGVGGAVLAAGNVVGNYLIGNGAFLTGLPASYGNADLANIGSNAIGTTGNISAGYYFGNGAFLTGIPQGYADANVLALLASGNVGNITANIIRSNATVTSNLFVNGDGQVTGNLNVGGNLNYTGVTNLSVANAFIYAGANNTTNTIDQGLITPYNAGNGQQYGGWSRDHVTGEWRLFSTATQPTSIVDWANAAYQPIRASAFIGDGGFLSNIQYANVSGAYGDSNVASYLPTNTADVGAGNVTVTGTTYTYNLSSTGTANLTTVGVGANLHANAVLTDNYLYANGVPVSFSGGGSNYSNANVASYLPVYGGNISANNVTVSALTSTGNLVATGNVTGTYILGNGAFLTGIAAGSSYGDSNVAAYLPTNTADVGANNIVATGNVTGTYVLGNGAFLTGLPAGYSNANAAAFLANTGANAILTTSSVTAAHFVGEGGNISNIQYTSVIGAYGNSNVTALLASGNVSTISTTGNVYANWFIGNNISSTGNLSVAGNLNVAGNMTYSNVNSVTVANAIMYLAANNTADLVDIGMLGSFNNGTQQQGGLIRDHATGIWKLVGNVSGTANTVNFTGATYPSFWTGGISSFGNVVATGNVTGTYVFGNGAFLTGLPAGYSNANASAFLAAFGSNNIVTTGTVTAGAFVGDGSNLTNLPTLYTNSNVAAYLPTNTVDVGAAGVIATGNITGANVITGGVTSNSVSTGNISAGNVSASGNVTAAHFIGDGSMLSNISRPVFVTSNIANLQAGRPLLVSLDMGNITYPGGVFTIYQPATGVGITMSDIWTVSGSNVKNQYSNFAGNIVETSSLSLTLSAVGGTFNIQSSDSIIIGPSTITGANITGLGISGTGGTYNIPAALFSPAVQTANSVNVTATLTTNNGTSNTAQSVSGTALATIPPIPFTFSGVSGAWPAANVVGSAVQSLNWSASGVVGTVTAGNVQLSGSTNLTLAANTATSGTSVAIASNVGPYNITAVYTGTGLYGAGSRAVSQVGSVTPATVIQPLFWKITGSSAPVSWSTADAHYDVQFSTSAVPSQGAFTSSNTSDWMWIAIPGTSWVLPDTWPNPTNSPNLVPRFDQPPFNGVVCIPDAPFIYTTTINGAAYTVYPFQNFNQSVFIYLRGN